MKKLFALLVVAGMVFVSCGNNQAEATVAEEAVIEEVQQDEIQQEATVDMPDADEAEETPAE